MLSDPKQSTFLQQLMKEGKIDPRIGYYIQMQGMCEKYGWTQQEFENTDLNVILAFNAIHRGISKSRDKKHGGNNSRRSSKHRQV